MADDGLASATLRYAMLRYAMLRYAMLRYAMLCYAMLAMSVYLCVIYEQPTPLLSGTIIGKVQCKCVVVLVVPLFIAMSSI